MTKASTPIPSEPARKASTVAAWQGAPLDQADMQSTLFGALRKARRERGGATKILEDHTGEARTYDALIRAACALGAKIAEFTSPREALGVLLPTGVPAAIVFFGLQAVGRVPAMLNFFAGAPNLEAACALAGVKHVLTSKRFLSAAKLEALVPRLQSVSFVYLEDIRRSLTFIDRVMAAARSSLAFLLPERSRPQDLAVILFTSGTTGAPKGVALSHANLLANVAQCRAHIPFDTNWVFFNALPVFHAFGLVSGMLLPILGGMRTLLYPSPLDHERIPKMIRATAANVLISTDTFAQLYARAADAQALRGLHYIVLGGERVNDATLRLLSEKTSAIVLQGYGTTECSPVIAANRPEANRPGTVGTLLPGIEARLEFVPGIAEGARLLVRGPGVMIGYLDPACPGHVAPRSDEWFDTGDLAMVDHDGFITITGRIKRFVRIGAEMVSLEAVEDYARSVWPGSHHAAVGFAPAGKGEAIILVTDRKNATLSDFVFWARTHDVGHFTTPQQILVVRKLPLLPTGKPDYMEVTRIVEKLRGKVCDFTNQVNEPPGSSATPARHKS